MSTLGADMLSCSDARRPKATNNTVQEMHGRSACKYRLIVAIFNPRINGLRAGGDLPSLSSVNTLWQRTPPKDCLSKYYV